MVCSLFNFHDNSIFRVKPKKWELKIANQIANQTNGRTNHGWKTMGASGLRQLFQQPAVHRVGRWVFQAHDLLAISGILGPEPQVQHPRV